MAIPFHLHLFITILNDHMYRRPNSLDKLAFRMIELPCHHLHEDLHIMAPRIEIKTAKP